MKCCSQICIDHAAPGIHGMLGELATAHRQYRLVPDQSDSIDQEGNSTARCSGLRNAATHIIVHQQIDRTGNDFGSVALRRPGTAGRAPSTRRPRSPKCRASAPPSAPAAPDTTIQASPRSVMTHARTQEDDQHQQQSAILRFRPLIVHGQRSLACGERGGHPLMSSHPSISASGVPPESATGARRTISAMSICAFIINLGNLTAAALRGRKSAMATAIQGQFCRSNR